MGGQAVATLTLRPGKERSLARRHPWLYDSAVARVSGRPGSGDTVRIIDPEGRFLAWAAFSPQSAIRARAWSFVESDRIDADWFDARIGEAIAARAGLEQVTDGIRLVGGEGDRLPGLIVDRYADHLVIQLLAAGVERWRDAIVASLRRRLPQAVIHERSDAAIREREGLAPREGPVHGEVAGPVPIVENGVSYLVDIVAGHKTGFYLDQRDNRARVAALARGRRLLNCFCYTGGFTLSAMVAGASAAVSIDSSADALAIARRNQQLNAIPDAACEWRQANVFDELKAMQAAGERFDLVVLDPPKFAPAAAHVDRAARAYKEINMKALRLLAPGGHLLTFSCSGAVSVDLFQKIVAGAVFDAGVDAQLVGRLGAGSDHPMLMTHPEGEYLKGLLLRRC